MALPTLKNTAVISQASFYSDRGTSNIYALARFFIENGNLKGAEQILKGLTEVAPNYGPGWLALAYVNTMENNLEHALDCADQAIKCNPELKQAILFQATCYLSLRDLSSAGTLLGEYGDLIDNGQISEPNHIRFFRTQIARFQALR